MSFPKLFGGMNMFVRGAAESNHAESALGHHSSIFKPWSGPPRTTKAELVRPHLQDARHNAINGADGVSDILKRAMGNRKALFART